MRKKYKALVLFAVIAALVVSNCLAPLTIAGAARSEKVLILATTTSTKDTGLLDYLLPIFKKKTGITVKSIAVGSGQALTMGQRGDADVLLVHSPAQEKTFMSKGYGKTRKDVMYNYFVIIGPKNDPAKVKTAPDALTAFKRIAAAKAKFVSRGDNSGTNTKELGFWKAAGATPSGSWYMKTGQGMAATIRIANEKNAYTLTDEGTYLVQKKSISLELLLKKTKDLKNQYGVITVNPAKHSFVNYNGAVRFSDFLTSREGQRLIGSYGTKKYGKTLFVPNAKK
ncbi:MAG TPA: substrate-binding domain-containing protein [Candidatus Aquicultor sp.]|jgi:tungstate transport system substrate-binding protein